MNYLTMKKILIINTFVMLTVAAFASPQYDAVYHLISKKYSLNADGSMDYRFRKEIQLLTKSAFDDYGETFIPYNTEIQSLDINEAYTIRKDGSIVQTPKNAFNPSLPYGCTDCERFNTIREMVVTHTALEYDATIVLDYTVHSLNPFMPELMERIDLYENVPIDQYVIEVEMPKEMTLSFYQNYQGKDMVHQMIFNEDSTRVTYRWVFSRLQARPSENYLLPDELPYMQLTTQLGPDMFVSNLLMQNAFMSLSFDGFKDVLQEVAPETMDPMDRVLAMRNYVAQNIHTNDVPMRLMNYIVASPFMVWNTNCGNRFEKDLLLYSMLHYAGFSATIGMLYNQLMSDPKSLVRVTIDGKNFFVTTADQSNRSAEIQYLPDSYISITGDISPMAVLPVNVAVSADIHLQQTDGKMLADVQVNKKELFSAATVTLRPEETKVAGTHVTSMGSGYYKVAVNDGRYGCNVSARYLGKQRQHALFVPVTNESYQYEITLPTGCRWVSRNYFFEDVADFGSVKISYAFGDNILTVTRELVLNTNVISTKQYAKFRKMMQKWSTDYDLIFTDKK